MDTARKNCIWYDQCRTQCYESCEYYWQDRFEESECERKYAEYLGEMQKAYMQTVSEYSDGRSEMQ